MTLLYCDTNKLYGKVSLFMLIPVTIIVGLLLKSSLYWDQGDRVTVLYASRGQGWNCQSVRWSIPPHFSRRTALRILAKLGMNVPHYMNKKRTGPFFRERSGSILIHEKV